MNKIAAAVVFTGFSSAALAGPIATFDLFDHPDVIYTGGGLRLDGVFGSMGGQGKATTFKFDVVGDGKLVVEDNGGNLEIHITGTVYGGEQKQDGTYAFGEGQYAVDFRYAANVAPSGTGWIVNPSDPNNKGTLTALANNNGVPMGTVINLVDKDNPNKDSFVFLQDDHRLAGYPQAGQGYWVGRGWLMYLGMGSTGFADWLFLAVPEPGVLAVVGLGGICAARRRRS